MVQKYRTTTIAINSTAIGEVVPTWYFTPARLNWTHFKGNGWKKSGTYSLYRKLSYKDNVDSVT